MIKKFKDMITNFFDALEKLLNDTCNKLINSFKTISNKPPSSLHYNIDFNTVNENEDTSKSHMMTELIERKKNNQPFYKDKNKKSWE